LGAEVQLISEETFAKEEARLGKKVHFHDGVWWVKPAPLYCKPVHPFRAFQPGAARPHFGKALLGYSHQVPDALQATRYLWWNILEGEDLRDFRLDFLKPKRRNMIRQGLSGCSVAPYVASEENVERMRRINISQATRLDRGGESGSYLPADYYETHAAKWREGILKLFTHRGHQLIGAFVGGTLAAYVDVIKIEDTWMFGAVKSQDEYLCHRPVDALYFTILTMASKDLECKRVLNGGREERPGLRHFKRQYHLCPVSVPVYTWSLLPIDRVRSLRERVARWLSGQRETKTKSDTKR
jgi:hypothetical protein